MERPITGASGRLSEFRVSGDAGNWGRIFVESKWVLFTAAQRIRRADKVELHESVGVYCSQETDGALVIRVIIFNPDWDEPMQIARIESRPDSEEELLEPLGFNLDHTMLSGFEPWP